MSLKITSLAAIAALMTLSAFSTPSIAAPATAGTCLAKGTQGIANVASVYASLLPSVRRQISAFGLRASMQGCATSVVCVASANTPEAMKAARYQCSVVTRALVLTSKTNTTPPGRKHSPGLEKAPLAAKSTNNDLGNSIVKKAVPPGGGLVSGMVYISLS